MLLLDIGNSRLKWAIAQGRTLRGSAARSHGGRPSDLLATLKLPKVGAIWVSSVMGAAHERQIARALKRTRVKVHFAHSAVRRAGLRVAYANPARLGVDRYLAMLALWSRTRGAFCVVNAGTALTFDAVDARGRHLGGLIAPGLATSWNAVRGATRFALAPKPADYTRGLGTDTDGCVRQGTLHACVGLIEHAARGVKGARFIGGGDAATLLPHLGKGWKLKPDLVLEGLLTYAREA